jgi:hypothetical protein
VKPISVCFATPGVWPLLSGRPAVYGGSELRALRFLRALAESGRYELSLIAFDHAPPRSKRIDSIAIIYDPVYAPRTDGILGRVLSRVVAPSEVDAWEQADAAVYVMFGVGEYSAKLARWARRKGRKSVLCAGSDSDFSTEYRPGASGRNSYGSRFDLCHEAVVSADMIIVQTRAQRDLLQSRFGRHGHVVANPIELAQDDLTGVPDAPRGYALWIGKADRVKRPELLFGVANRCSEITFKMVVNRTDTAAQIRDVPPNVEIITHVPRSELDRLFVEAFCLVNTSAFEGFPNTFLEAGRYRVPIVSLNVDPDGIVASGGFGVAANGDMEMFVNGIRSFHADRIAARTAGTRLREHVCANHAAPACYAEFERILRELVGNESAVQA